VIATVTMLNLDTLNHVGQALADPTRRAVLATLVSGPSYPGDLADQLDTTRSALSNHLACLRGCGLVTATYEGRRVRYELADPVIAEVLIALSRLPLGSKLPSADPAVRRPRVVRRREMLHEQQPVA